MAPFEEARRMLDAAWKDHRALAGMGDSDVFAEEVFGFHAQQAAEKALKAWLSLRGVEYPRTHDLSLLINALREAGEDVESLNDLIEFNPYAVQFRYDAFEEVGDPLDRLAITARVGELLRATEARLAAREEGP